VKLLAKLTAYGISGNLLTWKDILTFLHAFNVYVRPLLEYASCVWSPYHTSKITQTEHVQRRFTKRLPRFADITYKDRLRTINADSLELRRLRNDLLLAYKVLFNLVDVNAADFHTFANSRSNTRGYRFKLLAHNNRINRRKSCFLNVLYRSGTDYLLLMQTFITCIHFVTIS
jgi:hypothetical protein